MFGKKKDSALLTQTKVTQTKVSKTQIHEIFLDQFENDMKKLGPMFELTKDEKNVVKTIYNRMRKSDHVLQKFNSAIMSNKTSMFYKVDTLPGSFDSTMSWYMENYKMQAFLISVTQNITPLFKDMDFSIKQESTHHCIHISWGNISITKDDIINLRNRLFTSKKKYRQLEFDDLQSSADVAIFVKLINRRRKDLRKQACDGIKQLTGVRQISIFTPIWDEVLEKFDGSDDDFKMFGIEEKSKKNCNSQDYFSDSHSDDYSDDQIDDHLDNKLDNHSDRPLIVLEDIPSRSLVDLDDID